jgi:hypothetical protein
MKWYSAHVIMWFELKDNRSQKHFPVWENVILFCGENVEDVRKKADAKGKLDESWSDETLTWNDSPVVLRFGGVRKIVECQLPDGCVEEGGPLREGTEVTYSELTVRGRLNLDKLIDGESVTLLYD